MLSLLLFLGSRGILVKNRKLKIENNNIIFNVTLVVVVVVDNNDDNDDGYVAGVSELFL